MEKYLGQYRIPSARANWHHYAAPADYFITICTAGRKCLFGHIAPETADMILSPFGKIVSEEWYPSFFLRKELFCDTFIIMPNHVHAIVTIVPPVETHGNASLTHPPTQTTHTSTTHPHTIPTHPTLPPQQDATIPPPQSEMHGHASLQKAKKSGVAHRPPRSLSTFLGGFKGAVTRRINEFRHLPTDTPVWQTRFHDHIIRNAREYDLIKNYIETNPQRWPQDKFYVPL